MHGFKVTDTEGSISKEATDNHEHKWGELPGHAIGNKSACIRESRGSECWRLESLGNGKSTCCS